MTLDELVARLRAGGDVSDVRTFLDANPDVSAEELAAGAVGWGWDEVTEPIMLELVTREPDHFEGHRRLANLFFGARRLEESERHFNELTRIAPENPEGYRGLGFIYLSRQDAAGLRRLITEAEKSIAPDKYVDWQLGNSFIAAPVLERMAARVETERQAVAEARAALTAPAANPRTADPTEPESAGTIAETGGATEIGIAGATLSGRIAANADLAEWRFAYGADVENLNRSTEWRPVPGPLSARFRLSPATTPRRFRIHAGEISWLEDAGDGNRGGLMGEWPFGKDPNHVSGIGFIELLAGLWHNACQSDGTQTIHPWEASDLRGAEVCIKGWTENFERGDFLHCIGVGNVESYWFLSGRPARLPEGEGAHPFELSVFLSGDPAEWSTAGNNPAQAEAARYVYGPLSDALSDNVGNLVFVAPFGDWRHGTRGGVAIDEVTVTYRDRNILNPAGGAVMIEGPNDGPCDPAALTNGARGAPDAGWFQNGRVGAPIKFTWQLPGTRELGTLVFHQDPVSPARSCRVTVSNDGVQAHTWTVSLPDIRATPFPETEMIARLPEGVLADAVTLEILDAHGADGVALEAFEIFAKDHTPRPSSDPVTVSADIGGLTPGDGLAYRIECRADGQVVSGEVMEVSLPAGDAPVLHAAAVHHQENDLAVIKVRGNSMGQAAQVRWTLDQGSPQGISLGWEQTPVDRYITCRGLSSGAHEMVIELVSDAGTSSAATVAWTQ